MQLRNRTTTMTMAILGAAATFVTSGMITMTYPIQNQVFAQQQESQATSFIVQNTTNSTQDPLPGHQTHQTVIADPPRWQDLSRCSYIYCKSAN